MSNDTVNNFAKVYPANLEGGGVARAGARSRKRSTGTATGASLAWSCHAYVPVSQLIYAAFRSNAKGLLPPSDEWRRRGL
jgi:hypothetical protein